MKNLLIIITLISSTNVLAEWILVTRTDYGDTFWYESKSIQKSNDEVWIWLRTRYPEPTKNGHNSDKSYFKINCNEHSFQLLSSTYYKDKNWTKEVVSDKNKTEKSFIPPNSMMDMLAKITCK